MKARRHVVVALAIYLLMIGFYWFKRKAALELKLVELVPLTLGFLVPALRWARSLGEFKRGFWKLLAATLGAVAIYDGLLSLVVATHQVFERWYGLYPIGAMLLMFLLYVQATLSRPE